MLGLQIIGSVTPGFAVAGQPASFGLIAQAVAYEMLFSPRTAPPKNKIGIKKSHSLTCQIEKPIWQLPTNEKPIV